MIEGVLTYFKRSYSPASRLAFAIGFFFSAYFALQEIDAATSLAFTKHAIAGALSVFLDLLFLRVADEYKSRERSAKLFPGRVIPANGVEMNELRFLLLASAVGFALMNLLMGNALAVAGALLVLGGVAVKSSLFSEGAAKDVVIETALRNAPLLLLGVYAIAIYAADFDQPLFDHYHLWTLVIVWLPILAWDLAGRVREPQMIAAPSVVIGLQWWLLMSAAVLLHLSFVFKIFYTALACWCVGSYLHYYYRPSEKTARLGPPTEAYMIGGTWGFVLELVFHGGVHWR